MAVQLSDRFYGGSAWIRVQAQRFEVNIHRCCGRCLPLESPGFTEGVFEDLILNRYSISGLREDFEYVPDRVEFSSKAEVDERGGVVVVFLPDESLLSLDSGKGDLNDFTVVLQHGSSSLVGCDASSSASDLCIPEPIEEEPVGR